ncbi:MAG: ATP12 family protein [Pseudomonadota bacterium]
MSSDPTSDRDANRDQNPEPKTPPRITSAQDAPTRLKRFYKNVAVDLLEKPSAQDKTNQHAVLLDGRPIKTPARNTLALPTLPLAEAIAEEWDAQSEFVDPKSMPMTKLANTIIDGILTDPEPTRVDILAFAGQDLICYRAGEPVELVAEQANCWERFTRWAKEKFGDEMRLNAGIMPVEQSEAFQAGARAFIAKLEPWSLAPVHVMTTLTGSAVMALALSDGAVSADEVWTAAHVDEDWQRERWGQDAEAAARRKFRYDEMMAASRFLALSRA